MVFLNADGKAQPRPIQLGQQIGDRIEVIYGLQIDDQVVTRGNERLFPGSPLQINGQKPADQEEKKPEGTAQEGSVETYKTQGDNTEGAS